ncbi:MAG: DUF3795 domain-containing protein [Phycisphaerae bacterium]|nr:DUF3795 domain-containing protein [Phycisphaerae bacterium]
MVTTKKYPTIGVCGLDCGLCPRYYTAGPSRCLGCAGPDFPNRHPSCSFITCCVKKKGLEVCGECPDFPCSKFKSEDEYQQVKESSSYPPCRKVMANLQTVSATFAHHFQMDGVLRCATHWVAYFPLASLRCQSIPWRPCQWGSPPSKVYSKGRLPFNFRPFFNVSS